MRPTKLTMTAFGPYAEKTVIDFDKLGTNGIYLITGETGSGKTTIFDAVTYALYGDSSGGERSTDMFRSKYAAEGTVTTVELEFECKGKKYVVTRSPKIKEATGSADKSFCELREVGSPEILSDKSEKRMKEDKVSDTVRNIIGIDRDQFAQIAMIAQGDFRKLLFASTEERRKIYRSVFRTEKFDAFQEKLSDDAKALNDRYKTVENSINQYIGGIKCDEKSALYDDVKKAKKGELTPAQIDELLGLLLTADESDLNDTEDDAAKTDNELAGIAARLAMANDQKTAEITLKNAEEGIKIESALLAKLEIALKAAEAKLPERDALAENVTKLKELLPAYKELGKRRRETALLSDELTRLAGFVEQNGKKLTVLGEEIASLNAELAGLGEVSAELERSRAVKKDIETRRSSVSKLKTDIGAYEDGKRRLAELRDDCRAKTERYESLAAGYSEMFALYLREQAGILAETLKDGKACPVCGSTEHPQKAHKDANAPTADALKKAKADVEIAQKQASEASEKAGTFAASQNDRRADIEARGAQLSLDGDITSLGAVAEARLTELDDELRGCANEIAAAEKKAVRRDQIKTEIPNKEAERAQLDASIREAEKQTAEKTSKRGMLTELVAGLEKKLTYGSEEALNGRISELEAKRAEIKNCHDTAKNEYDECSRRLNDHAAAKKTAGDILANRTEIDVTAEEARRSELEDIKKKYAEHIKTVSSKLTANRDIRKNIDAQRKASKELYDKLTMTKAVSDTANGTLNGRSKLSFETYYQVSYFKRILSRANKRLMIMSGGQYELIIRTNVDRKRQSGLDLDIIDHFNGSKRDVRSLSGGESFLASLSLALGLSDEIQYSAGGVRVDTMFVDEGFGSLDEDKTLGQVMTALAGLSKGTKLVGIISHVGVLKEKIDRQIVVTKDSATGASKAEIIV